MDICYNSVEVAGFKPVLWTCTEPRAQLDGVITPGRKYDVVQHDAVQCVSGRALQGN
jgi:hypothetical protein